MTDRGFERLYFSKAVLYLAVGATIPKPKALKIKSCLMPKNALVAALAMHASTGRKRIGKTASDAALAQHFARRVRGKTPFR